MPAPDPRLPDDFEPVFLDEARHLPPHVHSHASPLFGSSLRPSADELRACGLVEEDRPPVPAERRAHTAILPGVLAIADRRPVRRNELLGPARLVLPEELLHRHWLWVGPPGAGKTTQGVLPMTAALLRDGRRSLVVFDPKGDQFGVLRDLAAEAGRSRRSVLRLNLADPAGSIGWNPLRRGMTRTEALAVAARLVLASEAEHSHDSPFWRNTSITLLVDVLLGLTSDSTETPTLPRALEVLGMPRTELLEWLKAHGAHRFASFLDSGSHNAETCLADTNMRLMSLLDVDLCAVLSHDELRLERLFEKPTVLVIEMNETRLAQQRPVFDMLVQQVLDRAIEAAERRPDARLAFPLSVVLDEFGSAIGAIPRFPVYLNTLRSRRVGVVAAVQSLAQVHGLYGADAGAVLAGFSSKVFFPNVEAADAEFASLACGTMTVPSPTYGPVRFLLGRRTFLPDEIARPRAHPVLGRPVTMLLADRPAFQAYLTPSYRLPGLRLALALQRRRPTRPRRKLPLVYVPGPAGAATTKARRALTDTAGMTTKQLCALVDVAEQRLGMDALLPDGLRFWSRLRRRLESDLPRLVQLCEELMRRGTGIGDLHLAARECDCEEPEVALAYLDFAQALSRHERTRRDAS